MSSAINTPGDPLGTAVAAVATHATLDTGVHGVGASTVESAAGATAKAAAAVAAHVHEFPLTAWGGRGYCRYAVAGQADVIHAPGYFAEAWQLNPNDGTALHRGTVPVPAAGTIKRIYASISSSANLDATNYYRLVLYKNNVATALEVTFNGAANVGTVAADVAVAAGDLLDIRLLATTGAGAAQRDAYNPQAVVTISYGV